MDRWMDDWMDEWIRGSMNGWMNIRWYEWMEGCKVVGWMDGCICTWLY